MENNYFLYDKKLNILRTAVRVHQSLQRAWMFVQI